MISALSGLVAMGIMMTVIAVVGVLWIQLEVGVQVAKRGMLGHSGR